MKELLASIDGSLNIEFATSSSSGSYECIADNEIDNKLSQRISIHVNGMMRANNNIKFSAQRIKLFL
jgi:hypothetical protein